MDYLVKGKNVQELYTISMYEWYSTYYVKDIDPQRPIQALKAQAHLKSYVSFESQAESWN